MIFIQGSERKKFKNIANKFNSQIKFNSEKYYIATCN